MKKIFLTLAAITVFFMTSLVPFLHTAEAWNPRPWTPKPWELREWTPEQPDLQEWKLNNSNELQVWKLREWVLVQHEMITWELESNPDLTPWDIRNLEMIAWELQQWDLELQGANTPGGLEGNTSANSPPANNQDSIQDPVQGPVPYPENVQSFTPIIGIPGVLPEGDANTNGNVTTSPTIEDAPPPNPSATTGPSTYDAIKFVSKDIVGATVNFADKMVRSGDEEALKNFSSFQKGLFLSGVKTFTKGNSIADSTFMVKDVVDNSKKAYDSIKDFRQVREMRALAQAGRIDDALQMAGSVKTYSATNAIVATALLPFSIADTVKNFNSIEGTSGWDRADSIVSTIGSAGGVIAGLAAPVAMIPGGQVIAAGLLAVGTVLSLGSVAYKAARNWRKIKDTAVGTVKSVGNGIKKIGSKIGSWFK